MSVMCRQYDTIEPAAEPRPIHVPRQRPAPLVLDAGPLVLVETRRDLSALRLPFDQEQAPTP